MVPVRHITPYCTESNNKSQLAGRTWLQAIVIDNLWQYQLVLPSPTPRAAK